MYKDKLQKLSSSFKNTIYNNIYVIGITYVLMKIISGCGFSIDITSTIVLTFRINVVSYSLSKVLFLLDQATINARQFQSRSSKYSIQSTNIQVDVFYRATENPTLFECFEQYLMNSNISQ